MMVLLVGTVNMICTILGIFVILFLIMKIFTFNAVEKLTCGMQKKKSKRVAMGSLACLISMILASSYGAYNGHGKIKDYIVLNNLEVAKDVSAAQALNKVAGVIQFYDAFVDFDKGLSIQRQEGAANNEVASCIFPILRGNNGKSSQKIVHFWAGACAADSQCCQQFHEKGTLCSTWERLKQSKSVPYAVLYMSPSCVTDYIKKASMKKFGLTAPSSAIMVLPTDNADITKAEMLSYGVLQCSVWVVLVSLLHLIGLVYCPRAKRGRATSVCCCCDKQAATE